MSGERGTRPEEEAEEAEEEGGGDWRRQQLDRSNVSDARFFSAPLPALRGAQKAFPPDEKCDVIYRGNVRFGS